MNDSFLSRLLSPLGLPFLYSDSLRWPAGLMKAVRQRTCPGHLPTDVERLPLTFHH